MLGKLLKHEFRATGRIMWPLYLVLLFLSFCANLSIRQFDSADSIILNILGGLIMTVYVIAIIGVCVMSVVLMINRFRTNLMSNEGYVMFTLPVSVHQLVWSKIIVSTVWFVATFLAVALSGLIVSFRVEYVTDFIASLQELFRQFTAYFALNGAAFLLETLVLVFLSSAAVCLLFYAAMAVGHSFANHKILLSVAFFFVFQLAAQLVVSISALGLNGLDMNWNLEPVGAVHAAMGVGIACTLIYGAVFYVITTVMLKKHLNLE
ncbi:MAG: hypothetical protein AB7C97_08345 [Oscillospiraceae bacterium]